MLPGKEVPALGISNAKHWLTVALPKGRLAGEVASLLTRTGILPAESTVEDRLIIEDHREKIRYVWLRPADTLTYVERGVAALGIAGKDVIEEAWAAVDELADLGIGICRVSVATPGGKSLSTLSQGRRPVRLATHLPRLTERYFEQRGVPVEIIYLRGSVEIAPRLGLADAVVDIVQTGRTLRANGLVEVEKLLDVSSRLIAHPGARRGGDPRLEYIIDALTSSAVATLDPAGRGTGS